METKKVSGRIVDPLNGRIFPGEITVSGGKISEIQEVSGDLKNFVLPPIVDAHIHIESSMLTPEAFAAEALSHGTVAVVADPHEIANVLGTEGVNYMIRSAAKSRLRFFFGAPSCVPASEADPSGAALEAEEVAELLKRREITHLGEMMNFPGVLNGDKEVMSKIKEALSLGKPVDGHAPGLRGQGLERYAAAGISTDHESTNLNEAVEKASIGMKVLIREGSAARDLDALLELVEKSPGSAAFCTDDIHAGELRKRHIDKHITKALEAGIDPLKIFRAASLTPIEHYKLPLGRLQPGDSADFVIAESLQAFHVLETWLSGEKVFSGDVPSVAPAAPEIVNNFKASEITAADLVVPAPAGARMLVMRIKEGSLLTSASVETPLVKEKAAHGDTGRDILKIVALNRYRNAPPAVAFVHGFGLKEGAIASSVAHDSHNIIAVGTNDRDLTSVINMIVKNKGGIAAARGEEKEILPLPVAGLMSDKPAKEVARVHDSLDDFAHRLGTRLKSPFMTLAFAALPVIPEIKLTSRGLFDVNKMKHVALFQ